MGGKVRRFSILVLAVVAGCTANGVYEEAKIDLTTLNISLGRFHGPMTAGKRGFEFFRTQSGAEIANCEARRGSDPQVCYNIFSVDHEGKLLYRTKYLELLRGPFGSVYGQLSYEYRPDVVIEGRDRPVRLANSLNTMLRSGLRYVPGAERGIETETLAQSPSAVSVIRIFQSKGQYFAASANYTKDGNLYSTTGDGGTRFGDNREAEKYGLPIPFPISSYTGRPDRPFGAAQLGSVLDSVFIHYDESYRVRRDIFDQQRRLNSVVLVFPKTDEDRLLQPLDRTREFAIDHTLQ